MSSGSEDLHCIYVLSAGGDVIKAQICTTDGTASVSLLYRYHQSGWNHTSYCFLFTFSIPSGTLLCLSCGGTMVVYVESNFDDSSVILDQNIPFQPVSGMNITAMAVDIMHSNCQRIKGKPEDLSSVCFVVSLRSGKLLRLKYRLLNPSDMLNHHGCLLSVELESTENVPVSCHGMPVLGMALDSLGLMIYSYYSIPPGDTNTHEAQTNKFITKPRVGLTISPNLDRKWTHNGGKVVDLLLDSVCSPKQLSELCSYIGNTVGFSFAILHSSISYPAPSYVHDTTARASSALLKDYVPPPRRRSMDTDEDFDTRKKKRNKAFIEPTAKMFCRDDNTSVLETIDICIRAGFLICGAIDSCYKELLRKGSSGATFSSESLIRSACTDLICQYRFDEVSSQLKFMGGIEQLVSVPQGEGADTNIFLRLLYFIDGKAALMIIYLHVKLEFDTKLLINVRSYAARRQNSTDAKYSRRSEIYFSG